MKPEPLDYSRDEKPPSGWEVFWAVFVLGALLCVFVVTPLVDRLLFGHPGDSVVACFGLASVVVTAAVLVPVFLWRPLRARPALRTAVAAASGLLATLPGYVFLWVFF